MRAYPSFGEQTTLSVYDVYVCYKMTIRTLPQDWRRSRLRYKPSAHRVWHIILEMTHYQHHVDAEKNTHTQETLTVASAHRRMFALIVRVVAKIRYRLDERACLCRISTRVEAHVFTYDDVDDICYQTLICICYTAIPQKRLRLISHRYSCWIVEAAPNPINASSQIIQCVIIELSHASSIRSYCWAVPIKNTP